MFHGFFEGNNQIRRRTNSSAKRRYIPLPNPRHLEVRSGRKNLPKGRLAFVRRKTLGGHVPLHRSHPHVRKRHLAFQASKPRFFPDGVLPVPHSRRRLERRSVRLRSVDLRGPVPRAVQGLPSLLSLVQGDVRGPRDGLLRPHLLPPVRRGERVLHLVQPRGKVPGHVREDRTAEGQHRPQQDHGSFCGRRQADEVEEGSLPAVPDGHVRGGRDLHERGID